MSVFSLFRKKKTEEGLYFEDPAYHKVTCSGVPFRMVVADVFTIVGRGTVVTGTVQQGQVSQGDTVFLCSKSGRIPVVISGIETFQKKQSTVAAGQHVGLLLKKVPHAQVERGDILLGTDEHDV